MKDFIVTLVTVERFSSEEILIKAIKTDPGFNKKLTYYSVQEVTANGERIGAKREGHPNVIDIRAKAARN